MLPFYQYGTLLVTSNVSTFDNVMNVVVIGVFVVDIYRCIARAVFNLQRLQFLVSVTCQMTRAERQLVKVKGQQAVATDTEMLLGGLVHLFEQSPLAFLDASFNPALRAVSVFVVLTNVIGIFEQFVEYSSFIR
jgi:hypothetical protein